MPELKVTQDNVNNTVVCSPYFSGRWGAPDIRLHGAVVILGRTYEIGASVTDRLGYVTILRRYPDGHSAMLSAKSSVHLFLCEWCQARAEAWAKTPEYAAALVQAEARALDARAAGDEKAVTAYSKQLTAARKRLAVTRREQRVFLRKHPELRKAADEVQVESVKYSVQSIIWPPPATRDPIPTVRLVLYGTYRGRRYRVDFEKMLNEQGTVRAQVWRAATGVTFLGRAIGDATRDLFSTLCETLAAAWSTTAEYDAQLLAVYRRNLVRAQQRGESDTIRLAVDLRAAKKNRTKARRALVAFDKKHPEEPEIPFG